MTCRKVLRTLLLGREAEVQRDWLVARGLNTHGTGVANARRWIGRDRPGVRELIPAPEPDRRVREPFGGSERVVDVEADVRPIHVSHLIRGV